MMQDRTTRRWHKTILADAERKLQRPLKSYEREFITSRTGYLALEMIHDTVKAATRDELESYLASERKARQPVEPPASDGIPDHPDPSERGCYCDLWEKSPETLERQEVPRGFCGLCIVCGKPGHTRHFPGAVPFTAAWCDRHYRRTLLFDPRGSVGCLLWLGIIALGVALGWWLWKSMPR